MSYLIIIMRQRLLHVNSDIESSSYGRQGKLGLVSSELIKILYHRYHICQWMDGYSTGTMKKHNVEKINLYVIANFI